MEQLEKLKLLLGSPNNEDVILQFYLDNSSDIICDIRNSDKVESKYLGTQIKMAIEMYNKRGVEGQISHSELGIGRGYEKADLSDSVLKQITPIIKTPHSKVRVVE